MTAIYHGSGLLASCSSVLYVANFEQSWDPSDIFCADEVNILSPGVVRLLFCSRQQNIPTITELYSDANERFLLHNPNHVLQSFLQERSIPAYSLRSRTHNKMLIHTVSGKKETKIYFVISPTKLGKL